MFRARYEEAAAASRVADAKLQTCHANKKTVVAERKAKGEQKAEAEKHLAEAQELVRAAVSHSAKVLWFEQGKAQQTLAVTLA